MVLIQPVKCIGDQEVGNLVFGIVKDLGTPVRMFSFARICIFIHWLSVKVGQSVGIFWKMSRYPVKNNADAFFVHVVNKIHEFFRGAVAGGRSKISGDLISPGAVKRMLGDAHQFNVGISHGFHIVCQFMGCLHISVVAGFFCSLLFLPGAQMDFIDCHWRLNRICRGAFSHPGGIAPFKTADICGYGCSARAEFAGKCVWIGLQ